MLNDYPDVLEAADIAEILKIGMNSTYRLLRSGAIRSHKVGSLYRIPKSCMVDYLEAARMKTNCHGKEQQ